MRVEDTPAHAVAGIPWPAWCIGGSAAVVLGSLLPFISTPSLLDAATVNISGGARGVSVIFGAIIVVLSVLAYRRLTAGTSRPGTPAGLTVPLFVLPALGTLGYAGFAVAGLVGFQDQADPGIPVQVAYSPRIGLVLAILGCVMAVAGAIGMLRAITASRRQAR